MSENDTLEAAARRYREAWGRLFVAVAEALRIPRFVAWLDRKLQGTHE